MRKDAGNRAHWRGKAGFFEIWFLVIFVPGAKRAIWLRYTLFAPAPGQPGQPRATLWAAAFDASAPEPKLALKSILPIDTYAPNSHEPFGIRLGDAEFSNGICRGRIEDQGRSIVWDLTFDPSADHDERHSVLLSPHLPMRTRAIHSHEHARFRGTYSVDGQTFTVENAPGLQKHIWGKKRVEELFWLYCPHFPEDPSARLEITSVRVASKLIGNVPFPSLAPVWFVSDSAVYEYYAAWHLFRNDVKWVHPGKLHLRAGSLLQSIEVDANCDTNTLVGYVYRDPYGQDLYVAQSDIATCTVRLFKRPHPFAAFRQTQMLTSTNGAAIEFHLPKPLPGVRYIGWDETSLEPRD